jgi:hypothetical protein
METLLRYRGRAVGSDDVESIKALMAERPGLSRRALSIKVCEAWDWVQPNGTVKDAVCRGLLLALARAGHIRLPPPQWTARRPPIRHAVPPLVEVDQSPLVAGLKDIGDIEVRQVRATCGEALVDSLIAQHHYLGYVHPVGEHLKYLVTAQDRPLACFTWSSAARHLGPRDRYIGWSQAARRANIHLLAYQSRYLIMPWVRVPHLASHLLGRMSRQLSRDWQRIYAHPIYFIETFVEPERFRGTCYRAANWAVLGMTTGRGKDAPTMAPNRSLKQVLGYAVDKHFRRRLCGAS